MITNLYFDELCSRHTSKLIVDQVISTEQLIPEAEGFQHDEFSCSSSSRCTTPRIPSTPWSEYLQELCILVVFSNPSNTNPLRLQAEEKCIKEALGFDHKQSKIVVKFLPACTIDDLTNHLLRYSYHVIHFSGHSDRTSILSSYIIDQISKTYKDVNKMDLCKDDDFKKRVCQVCDLAISQYEHLLLNNSPDISVPVYIEHYYQSKSHQGIYLRYSHTFSKSELSHLGVGSLTFESQAGQASFIPPSAFATLLSQHNTLQCLILNACGSLIQGHYALDCIPLTVCYKGQVADQESIAFSQGFYSSLQMGTLSLEACYRHGVNNVELKRMHPGFPRRPTLSSYEKMIVLLKNELLSQRCYESLQTIEYSCIEVHSSEKQKEAKASFDAENLNLKLENEKLRALVQYGMQLLQSKDQELELAKAMIKLLIADCTNPNSVQLANILLSQSKSGNAATGVNLSQALHLISSLGHKSAIQDIVSNSPESKRQKTATNRSSQSSKKGSELASSSNSKKRPTTTIRPTSDTTNRRMVNDNRPRISVKAATIPVKATNASIARMKTNMDSQQVKIAFGYRNDATLNDGKNSKKSSQDINLRLKESEIKSKENRIRESSIPRPRQESLSPRRGISNSSTVFTPVKSQSLSSSSSTLTVALSGACDDNTSEQAIFDKVMMSDVRTENRTLSSPTSVALTDSPISKFAKGKQVSNKNSLQIIKSSLSKSTATNASSIAFRNFLQEKRSAIQKQS